MIVYIYDITSTFEPSLATCRERLLWSPIRCPHNPFSGIDLSLGKFLFDEEGSQVRELPGASDAEDNDLDQHPPYHAGIR
jgi:hypothetical protein